MSWPLAHKYLVFPKDRNTVIYDHNLLSLVILHCYNMSMCSHFSVISSFPYGIFSTGPSTGFGVTFRCYVSVAALKHSGTAAF